jgi:hypothetical protein
MKHWMTAMALACCSFGASAAPEVQVSCDAQAADRKLAGAAKASFVKKCQKDHPAPAAASAPSSVASGGACETQAADKKLAGAARNSFVKKCEKDAKAGAAGGSCEARAAEKKLAGAAKTSFVKKCTADAAAG